MSIFNNQDFYPTPVEVSHQICQMINLEGRVVLEPSMGKGDLVDVIREYSPKQIIGCESSEDLLKISMHKVDRVIGTDFLELKKEEVSHINCIIANPPFSNAENHIIHMWDIAPEGCAIVSLCNWETIENKYSNKRDKLNFLIKQNGSSECLGECFIDAERKTNVAVGLVILHKPIVSEDNYDIYFDMFDQEEKEGQAGLMEYNEIRSIVQRYVGALKMFNSVIEAQDQMNSLISPLTTSEHNVKFIAVDGRNNSINFETFKSELQKSAWTTIFKKIGAEKYMTSSLKSFLNCFVEKQKNVPFTMPNIYKMIEMVVGTQEDRMKKVIIEVFDWITEHHSENRFFNEGWKTNSEYIVNRKFVAPYCGVSVGSGYPEIKNYKDDNRINDLLKALCYITGNQYDIKDNIDMFFNCYGEDVDFQKIPFESERLEGYDYLENIHTYQDRDYQKHTIKELYKYKKEAGYVYNLSSGYDNKIIRYKLFGVWYDWKFFRVKVYKKGTIHLEFLDEKVWVGFNQVAAKAKGFQLASKFTGNFRKKETGVEVYGR